MQEWVELAAQVLLRLTETLVVLYQEEAESFAFFLPPICKCGGLNPPALPRAYQGSVRGLEAKGFFFVCFSLSCWLWAVLS